MRALCRIQWGDAPAKVVPRTWSVGVVAREVRGSFNRLCPFLSVIVLPALIQAAVALLTHGSECPARIALRADASLVPLLP